MNNLNCKIYWLKNYKMSGITKQSLGKFAYIHTNINYKAKFIQLLNLIGLKNNTIHNDFECLL